MLWKKRNRKFTKESEDYRIISDNDEVGTSVYVYEL